MQNEATAKQQNSVDRARAPSHRLLHRCTAELRRLQTERHFLNEILAGGASFAYLGLADFRAILKGLDERTAAALRTHILEGTDNIVSILENQHRQVSSLRANQQAELTKQTKDATPQAPQIARNAPCL